MTKRVFVKNLFMMVTEEPDSVVAWQKGGTTFKITDVQTFKERVPLYYKSASYSNFKRQLKAYGFEQTEGAEEFKHALFREKDEAAAATITKPEIKREGARTAAAIAAERKVVSRAAAAPAKCNKPETETPSANKWELSCAVCFFQFVVSSSVFPLALDCGHILCSECWDLWSAHCESSEQVLHCMVCKEKCNRARKLYP
jgi:HSF-type DNA-binding